MTEKHAFPDLDLEISPRSQRMGWTVERVAWMLMVGAIAGAFLGIYGDPIVILRAASIYLFLLVIVRASGKRTLSSLTVFDLILTLIISECVQNAIVGEDKTLLGGMLAVTTLVVLDIGLSVAKEKFPTLDSWIDGSPAVLVNNGAIEEHTMRKERVDKEDVLEAARELHGLERLEQVRYAILERSGKIAIIPFRSENS